MSLGQGVERLRRLNVNMSRSTVRRRLVAEEVRYRSTVFDLKCFFLKNDNFGFLSFVFFSIRLSKDRDYVSFILPGTYHAGFNQGFNKAAAIIFCSKNWLKTFGEFKTCSCEQ